MKKKEEIGSENNISRGDFIKKAGLAGAGFFIVPRFVFSGKGYVAPSDRLYIAAVGCGGEAENDIRHYATAENDIHHYPTTPKKNAVVAFLCDVDERQAAPRIKEFPKAKFFTTGGKCSMKIGKTLMPLQWLYPIITMLSLG